VKSDVQHEREMILNAHFAWGLCLWASAEVARERGNTMLSPIGYYYAAFHAGFAAIMTDHTFNLAHTKDLKHNKMEKWLERNIPECHRIFVDLKMIRETVNYLGVADGSGAWKLRAVRGHETMGVRFCVWTKNGLRTITSPFIEMVSRAGAWSTKYMYRALDHIEAFCVKSNWRFPKRHDDEWFMEYLGEDFMHTVIPSEADGPEILLRVHDFMTREKRPRSHGPGKSTKRHSPTPDNDDTPDE
jgi:hypothetical protein